MGDIPKTFVKPCEIPVYGTETKSVAKAPEEPGPAYNTMLEGVGIARQAVRQGWDQLKDIRTATEDIYQTGKAHTLGTLDMLRADENLALRAGVIAGGGFLGLIVGMMRGRLLKRLFYTSLGAGSATSVCYPKETVVYSKGLYIETQRLSIIAYNFVTGVQPSPESPKTDTSSAPEGKK